jgi:hypothetical protein
MDIRLDRRMLAGRPARGACQLPGCSCKDARIISRRQVAFFAAWARSHGETADRRVEPDPDWRSLFLPSGFLVLPRLQET